MNLFFLFKMKTMENSSIQIKKKKKKQTTKLLPKNVFEIVGNQGELVERVQPKDKNEKKTKKENESKVTFSERTTKRRVSPVFFIDLIEAFLFLIF